MIRTGAFSFLGDACPHIECYRLTDSTNLRARVYAGEHPGEDAIFFADAQSAGRGRLGRRFESPEGSGLYMSFLLHPTLAPDRMGYLTTYAAVAVACAIEELTAADPRIKWVNDVFMNGKKVAGILAEGCAAPDGRSLLYAVLGIGINLSHADFPPEVAAVATSVEEASGVRVDAEELAKRIVRRILCATAWDDPDVMREYRRRSLLIGRHVDLVSGDSRRGADVLDILDTGALFVRFSDGTTEAVSSGEVSVRLSD